MPEPNEYFDRSYLLRHQYHDTGNLNARILIHSLFSTGKQAWHDFVFERLPAEPGLRLLALGCGNATQWQENQARFARSTSIFLTDISHGMLREAQDSLGSDSRFLFSCQDAEAVAFPPAFFDFITANHMLYHVPGIDQALSEVVRLLKPGGGFMAATNGVNHMRELDELMEGFSSGSERNSMAGRFSLESAPAQLGNYFARVELHMYPSDLWVTDADLLAAYAFSMPRAKENFSPERKREMTRCFQQRIDADGGIFIRKRTGLFLASEPII